VSAGERARSRLRGCLLPALILVGWELFARAEVVSPYLLPPFTEVVLSIGRMAADGSVLLHVAASGGRVLAGFVAGGALGIFVGFATGLSRRREAYFDPTIQAIRSIPSLAWVPLLLLWLGIGEASKVVLIAVGAFFPLYLSVFSAARNVDRKYLELGDVYGFSRADVIRRIIIPSAIPALLTGLRTAAGVAWLYVVAAELIAAHRGLGFLLTDGRELSRPDLVFASIFLLAMCGKLTDDALKVVERRLTSWQPRPASRAIAADA